MYSDNRRVPALPNWIITVLFCALVSALQGQNPANNAASAGKPEAQDGSVSGRVIDANTSRPLPGFPVSLFNAYGSHPTKTDAQGRFHFDNLARRRYGLAATTESYTSPVLPVDLSVEQKVTGIEIKVFRNTAVSGIVQDGDYHPVAGVKVAVLSLDGLRSTPNRSAMTNERGEFRISNLRPGHYKLLAERHALQIRPGAPDDESLLPKPVEAHISTYYPSSSSFEGGGSITLATGQVLDGINITLVREKTACIVSKVIDAVAGKTAPIKVYVKDEWHIGVYSLATADVQNGTGFSVCGLGPGPYTLSGWIQDHDNGDRSAEQDFYAGGRNTRVADLDLRPLLSLPGRVTIDKQGSDIGQQDEDKLPGPLAIQLQHLGGCSQNERASAVVKQEGPFVLPAVCPVKSSLHVMPTQGLYLKAASLDGKDVLRGQFLPVGRELRIVLGEDGATLTVEVEDQDGHPLSGASVVLVRDPPQPDFTFRDLIRALSGADGKAVVKAIAPGAYRVAALAPDTLNLAPNPDFFRAHSSQAELVKLSAKENRTVKLKAIADTY